MRFPDGQYDPTTVASCLRLADRAGIDRLVYLFGAVWSHDPTQEEIRRSNDLGIRLVTERPDRFTGFCYLNPSHDPTWTLAEFDRCVAAGPLRGVTLWIAVKADDGRLDPIMRRAAQLRVPVLHHAWYKATGLIYNESTPAEIATLARRHPDVVVIMAHLGGGGWRGVLDIRDCPNVVVDTSGSQPQAGQVEYAVAELGAERVVFGSDWPIRDFGVQRARVDGARLTKRQRNLILGGNMLRILGMRSATVAT